MQRLIFFCMCTLQTRGLGVQCVWSTTTKSNSYQLKGGISPPTSVVGHNPVNKLIDSNQMPYQRSFTACKHTVCFQTWASLSTYLGIKMDGFRRLLKPAGGKDCACRNVIFQRQYKKSTCFFVTDRLKLLSSVSSNLTGKIHTEIDVKEEDDKRKKRKKNQRTWYLVELVPLC